MEDEGDKKYDPTPRRRKQFRDEGRIARARDAAPAAAGLLVVLVLVGTLGEAKSSLFDLFRASLGDVSALSRGQGASVRTMALGTMVTLVVPAVVAACVGAIVLGAAQSGLQLNLGLVEFKAERLDPISKIKQMFSLSHGGVELLLSLAKVVLVGGVAYQALHAEWGKLTRLASTDFVTGSGILFSATLHLALNALLATAVIAAADYAQSWFRLEREMKMTLKELRDDMRSEDGDPHVKAKMKARARALSKKRMMADVKHAAVIVTNPTHVSVALRYTATDPAPVVVAKGHDDVALAIRREARAHGVPIMENRRLARSLDAEIPIGKPVKMAHFAAVARLLSLVYRLKSRGRPQAAGTRRA